MSFTGTNSIRFAYNRIDVERSDGAVCLGGDADVCFKRTGANEATVTNGSSGTGKLTAAFRAQLASSAPFACSGTTEGYQYFNTSSKELCLCDGTSWTGLKAGGAC
jgi:hypothetical protein